MIDLSTLMQGLTRDADHHAITVTEDWLQGRTIYGGLAAAICVESTLRDIPDLPPLRSAQFSFVGPAAGRLTAQPAMLRRGKSTAFVAVDLNGEGGLATRATLCFGAARQSALNHETIVAPIVPRWDACPPFFPDKPLISFMQHFESRRAGGGYPLDRSNDPTLLMWLSHRGSAPSSVTGLIALADAPPPAAMVMFEKFAPISTMTWTIDLLTDRFETEDGWWLVRSAAENIVDGYSSQTLTVWNASGKAIAIARQNVAVFI
ncbi:thioesterase family protein [Bradyrhizobium prioriisuperbiae]|uniref:thioesterase family protein n=1 Tax=Bradyrhizobium prioriisuperbiae TaxID=2854389 RepID=UPI0028E3F68F|nr:thioesterase family protein [Bradyrhizobium prioritasuperba]